MECGDLCKTGTKNGRPAKRRKMLYGFCSNFKSKLHPHNFDLATVAKTRFLAGSHRSAAVSLKADVWIFMRKSI
jgi:hypothetical protein